MSKPLPVRETIRVPEWLIKHPDELFPLREAALEVALQELKAGVREEGGENRGERVSEYLAAAGIHTPAPWCMAFVGWCAEQAAQRLSVESPLEAIRLQAYVQATYEWARRRGKLVEAEDALPGDLFVLYYPSLKRYGHVGFVRSVDVQAGTFRTVEGNTGRSGQREGDVVASKTRRITERVKFIRWTER